MSNRSRAELKQAFKSLNVSKPLRIPRELGFKPPRSSERPEAPTPPSSSNTEESLAKAASVKAEQVQNQTVAKVNSVQDVQSHQNTASSVPPDPNDQNQPVTVSNADSVQSGSSGEAMVSDSDSHSVKRSAARTDRRSPFTAVPHQLLRGECRFKEPIDFMVYLHLFTYSHGFGRSDAHMSQAQLERFTGSSKNTIKRSLERLVAAGFIKCVEEYECARMSRKWRISVPSDPGEPGGSHRGGASDTLHDVQGSGQKGQLSKPDTQTLSKSTPFKETTPKEKSKNSLSPQGEGLQTYFSALKPQRKRESEWKAFVELREDFSEEQISACMEHLLEKGTPGAGEPCHSPMAFLSRAMDRVWSELEEIQHRREELRLREEEVARRKIVDAAREAEEAQIAKHRLQEFVRSCPSQESRQVWVQRAAAKLPRLDQNGPIVQNLASRLWWEDSGRASAGPAV